MSLITDILDEEILKDPSYKKFKKVRKYHGYEIRRDSLSFGFIIRVKANNRVIDKILYDRDIIKEETRLASLSRILKEIHEALTATNV